MNSFERFHAAMTYQPRDRAPFKEFPWPAWAETAELWSQQGGYAPQTADFGCDKWVVEFLVLASATLRAKKSWRKTRSMRPTSIRKAL